MLYSKQLEENNLSTTVCLRQEYHKKLFTLEMAWGKTMGGQWSASGAKSIAQFYLTLDQMILRLIVWEWRTELKGRIYYSTVHGMIYRACKSSKTIPDLARFLYHFWLFLFVVSFNQIRGNKEDLWLIKMIFVF